MTLQSRAAATPTVPVTGRRPSYLHRIWPVTGLALGLTATVAWIALLGYGLIKLL